MLLIIIFLLAAGIVILAPRLTPLAQRAGGPRAEGVIFVGAVLLATLLGLALHSKAALTGAAPTSTNLPRGIPSGGALLLLTGVLYALSALRGARGLPAWLADILVVAAAYAAVLVGGEALRVQVLRQPNSSAYINLGAAAVLLTVFWMWAIARMTAALNRMAQVTGGYLGIVALTLLLLLQLDARTSSFFSDAQTSFFFPSAASAALAGAGLATVPLALRRSDFNLGWSAALAMGFLLAQIAAVGLLKNTTFAILALSLLAFGLPLLDVSFYQLRAALRGKKVTWEEQRLRLHEALLRRGLSPAKIALLYLAIGLSLCALGVLTARLLFTHQ